METKKDYIEAIEGAERRFLASEIEVRANDNGEMNTIDFTPIVFNSTADLGWFEERIEPGAFDGLIETQDVRALKNHDPNYVLARSNKGQGTLLMKIDDSGVHCSFEPRDRSYMNDLKDEIKSGDISQGSFAFSVEEQEWRDSQKYGEKGLRVIKKIRGWYDVSIVTYPAYPDTTVARSLFDATKKKYTPTEGTKTKWPASLRKAQLIINQNKVK